MINFFICSFYLFRGALYEQILVKHIDGLFHFHIMAKFLFPLFSFFMKIMKERKSCVSYYFLCDNYRQYYGNRKVCQIFYFAK